ncbi:beta-galactosidase trimerization domain-containing protein [Beduinella massiliensis]|uniref:beta-galactosidase trimerization domain-containing protein n=1 Tax=Beduinella massiliensis TaxID=1852363 RepID=UPI000C82CD85
MGNWWEDYAWRQVQTNLREIDMADIDADRYVRELRALGATVAMINAGGILASYETDLPFHQQSEYLTGDSLRRVIDACHAADIRVVMRTDFSKMRRAVFEEHPDWAYRTIDGKIVDYNGDVHACVCGGFQQKAALEILREIVTKLPADGLFINMSGFQTRDYSYREYGICHCEACRQAFRAYAGMELPASADMKDPAYRRYRAFQRHVLEEQESRIVRMVREINPQIAINGTDFFRMESNTEYGRPLPHWQYSASSNTRCLRGIPGGRTVSNTSVDFIGFYYRHVAVSAALQKLRLWQDLANLGGLDYYLIGRLDNHEDRSGFEAVQAVFHFAREHETDYRGLRSCADVLVLRSHAWGDGSEERGWIRALTESHVLFDEALEADILAYPLDKYRVVVVPGIEVLSRAATQKLDDFAERGGCVIVSGNAARYDEAFETYERLPLRCLGIRRELGRREDMLSAMFRLSGADKTAFSAFEQSDLVCFGECYHYCEYEDTAHAYMRLIPPHPYGPPERCYYTQVTNFPGVTANTCGAGKGIYIPWSIGTLYYREGYENTLWVLQGVLERLAGLKSAAPGLSPMVEVTAAARTDGSGLLIQLVNASGHFGTSFFPPLPVECVRVRIPCSQRMKRAESLIDGRTVSFKQDEDMVWLEIGPINEFEAVKVEMEQAAER